MNREVNKVNKAIEKIRFIIETLVKVYKRFDKISPKIQILVIYMFSGLSTGLAVNVKGQFPKIILMLIYAGGLYTIQVLNMYCKRNELKVFEKMNMNLLGTIIAIISFAVVVSTFPIGIG